GMDGLELLSRVRAQFPEIKVAMLSAVDEPEVAPRALEYGAVAYLGKRVEPSALISTIHGSMDGSAATQTLGPRARPNAGSAEQARSTCATSAGMSRVRAPMRSVGQPARARAAASSTSRCGLLSRIRMNRASAVEAPTTTTAPARTGCSFGRILRAPRHAASW